MRILTCAVCGVPLRPEEARKCQVCGHIVCKDHIVYYKGKWMCTTCYRKAIARERAPERKEMLLAEIAAVEF
jgi:hypothetical protein